MSEFDDENRQVLAQLLPCETGHEVEQLRVWASKYKISQINLDSLLAILQIRPFKTSPEESNTTMEDLQISTSQAVSTESINTDSRSKVTSKDSFSPRLEAFSTLAQSPVKDSVLFREITPADFISNCQEGDRMPRMALVNADLLKNLVASNIALQKETQKMSVLVRNLCHHLRSKKSTMSTELSLTKKYNIQLPIKSITELQDFERKLCESDKCLNDTIEAMKLLLNEKKLSKSVADILKKFLARTIAVQFTATKQMPNKYVLEKKCPKFFMSIKEAVLSGHKGTSEKKIITAIGTVLTNSKDWDNNRALRRRERQKETWRVGSSKLNINSDSNTGFHWETDSKEQNENESSGSESECDAESNVETSSEDDVEMEDPLATSVMN